jgi:nucleoside phosphorylase
MPSATKNSPGLNKFHLQQGAQTAITVTTLASRKDTHLDSLKSHPSQLLPGCNLTHQIQPDHSDHRSGDCIENTTLNGSSLHESPVVSTTEPSRPRSRDEFDVAIICALQTEANAIQAIFDKHWDEDSIYQYGKQSNDPNSYSVGLIGNHNVVLAHQPRMGKVTAANVAAACSMSFTRLKLALIVGVCGGVPAPGSSKDIILGDVVISKGIVQYDFGSRYPDRFRQKVTIDDQLGRPNREISSLLAKLETDIHRQRLQATIASYLDEKDRSTLDVTQTSYPGQAQDKLFQATYHHKHQEKSRYCHPCVDEICDKALNSTCEELKCDRRRLVPRLRKNERNRPFVHFGLIASGDTVLKSGTDRDVVAHEAKVIAFEMEGSGVWDTIPCVIIKGVCDYADSHKNKVWQDYAATTAAASAKAFLRHWSANG